MSIEACQTPNKSHVNSSGNGIHSWSPIISLMRMSAGNRYNARSKNIFIKKSKQPQHHQQQEQRKIMFYCRSLNLIFESKFKRFSSERERGKRTQKKNDKIIRGRKSKMVTAVEFLRTKSKLSKVNGIYAT